jgi:hypothetical protein
MNKLIKDYDNKTILINSIGKFSLNKHKLVNLIFIAAWNIFIIQATI